MVQGTVLNPAILERIARAGGPDLIARLRDSILDHAPMRFRQLLDAIRNGDLVAVEKHAHFLRSSTGNVGANRLREQLGEVEAAAEARHAEQVRQASVSLENRFEEFLEALHHVRAA